MSVIVRPLKTGGSTDVVAGNDVLASEWNGDLNTIYNEFNGNIDSANIKTAGIAASNLQSDSVTEPKITANAVTAAKIAADAVTTGKILNLNVTGAKIATATIGTDKLKITIHEVTVTNYNPTSLGVVYGVLGCQADDSGTNWAGSINIAGYDGLVAAINVEQLPVNPTGGGAPFAKATYDLIGMFVKNVVISGGGSNQISCKVVYVFLTKVS